MKLRSALALASYVGMSWRFARPQDLWPSRYDDESPQQRWSWTGSALVVMARRSGTDVLHEICHWLTATKSMRGRREFGLGNAPFGYVTSGDRDEEMPAGAVQYEVDTCVLELLLRERVCSRDSVLRRSRAIGIQVERGLSIREGLPLAADPTDIPEGEWFDPRTIRRLAAVMRSA